MPKRMKKPFRYVAEQKVETAMYEPMVCPPALPIMYIYMNPLDWCAETLLSWLRSRGHSQSSGRKLQQERTRN